MRLADLQLDFCVRGPVGELWGDWDAEDRSDWVETVFAGPVGVAKTASIVYWYAQMCREHPGLRVLWTRKERVRLTQAVLHTFRKVMLDPSFYLLRPYGDDPPAEVVEEARRYLWQVNGYLFQGPSDKTREEYVFRRPPGYHGPPSKIIVAGLNDETRLFSAEFWSAFVNEAKECAEEQWENLHRALRDEGPGDVRPLVGDTNPDHPRHWIIERAKRGLLRLRNVSWEDNPWVTESRKGRAFRTKVRTQYTGHRWRRMYGGEWCAAEGQVFPEFSERKHVLRGSLEVKEGTQQWFLHITHGFGATMDRVVTVPITRFFAGQDWGWTNPGVEQVWAMDAEGRMFLVQEHYHSEKPLDWWAEVAASNHKRFALRPIACDPSRPGDIEALNDRLGTPRGRGVPRIAIEADNEIDVGLDHVRDRLMDAEDGQPRIFFLETALAHPPDPLLVERGVPTRTIDEVPGYVYRPYDPEDPDTHRDKPVDKDNHGMDAMRYACRWAWLKKTGASEPVEQYPGPSPASPLGSWGHIMKSHRKRPKAGR